MRKELTKFSNDKLIILCGESKTGKSTVIKECIYNLISKHNFAIEKEFIHHIQTFNDFESCVRLSINYTIEYTIILRKDKKYIALITYGDDDEGINQRVELIKKYANQKRITISLYVIALNVCSRIQNKYCNTKDWFFIRNNNIILDVEKSIKLINGIRPSYNENNSPNKNMVDKIVNEILKNI